VGHYLCPLLSFFFFPSSPLVALGPAACLQGDKERDAGRGLQQQILRLACPRLHFPRFIYEEVTLPP